MKPTLLTLVSLFIFIFIFCSSPHVYTQNYVQERAASAPFVFEGKVISQQSFWDDKHQNIYTSNLIQLSRLFKGDIQGDLVEVLTMGGVVDDRFSIVTHSISFRENEEGLFFCHQSPIQANRHQTINLFLETHNGELGFITYSPPGKSPKAYDHYGVYQQFHNDLYDPISKTSGTEVKHLNLNSWEKSILKAAEKYISETELTEKIIEFSFDNIQLSSNGSYVEFDVMAQTNENGLLFGKADIFIEYDTIALGSNIVQSGTLEVNKEIIINTSAYSMTVTDDADNIVKFGINSSFSSTSTAYALSTLPEKLFHVKITVDNAALVLISMNKILMDGRAYYFDSETDSYIPFDKILVDDPITEEVIVTITHFYPNPVTAGTFDTLTIVGENFGTTPLVVWFRNADDYNSAPLTGINSADGELISWADTLIQVIVPSEASDGSAATGKFKITTPSGDIESDTILDVRYSVLNTKIFNQVTAKLDPFRIELADMDGQGGYTFHLDSFLNVQVNGVSCTKEAICTWNRETGVSWMLSNQTSVSYAADDGINAIFFNPTQTNTSFLQQTFIKGRIEDCTNNNGSTVFYADDIDIEVNGYYSWEFDCEVSFVLDTLYDYFSALLHEFGHAHCLDHALPQPKVMKPEISPGDNSNTVLHSEDINGGNDVMDNSQNVMNGACPDSITDKVMPSCMVGVDDLEEILRSITIYPNPFSDELTIEFDLPRPTVAQLILTDILGRTVTTNNFGKLFGGNHLLSVNPEHTLPSGLYVLTLNTDEYSLSYKILKH